MSIFDDFLSKTKQAAESVGSNIGDYITDTVTAPFIRDGQPDGGDMTADQINNGQTGYNNMATLKPSSVPAAKLMPAAAPGTMSFLHMHQAQVVLVIVGVLAVALFMKKR